jgi:hypothetical protein
MDRSARTNLAITSAAVSILAAAVATWSCEEGPIGPHGYHMIDVGDTVSGRLPAVGNIQFAFPAEADSTYAVFLQALGGTVSLSAVDVDRGQVLSAVQVAPGHQLLERATSPIGPGQVTVLLVVTGPEGVEFRFFVYRVRRMPESRSSRFALGDTVQESLETLADIDTFVVAGTADVEVVAYIHASDTSATGAVSLGVEVLGSAGSVVGDSDLEQSSTGRFVLPATRDYRITVQAASDPFNGIQTYQGQYRFQLRAVQHAPESVTSQVQLGDTVSGERLDYVGDIDDFTITGAPGQAVHFFFQATSGSANTRLQLVLLDTAGQPWAVVRSNGADPDLFGQAVGPIALPGTGTVRLEVLGEDDRAFADRSPYRFWVFPVDRHPETAGDTVAYRDSILTESIDAPGDIDEFHVSVPESTLANLVVKKDAEDGSVNVALFDSTSTQLASVYAVVPGGSAQSGAITMTPGDYLLRAEGYFSQYRGHYEIRLYAGFTQAPESLSDTFVVPDTVSGEAISPPGDADIFRFYGRRGDHVNLALEGQAAPSTGWFSLYVSPDVGSYLTSPTQPDSLGAHESGRLDLKVDGWYYISVSGGSNPPLVIEPGPYRFAVTNLSTAPERVIPTLAPGDSVIAEDIDSPSDWDEFTLTGTPGQLLTIVTRTINPPPVSYLLVQVFDSITTDTVAWTAAEQFDKPTGYFTMPSSGRLKVAAYRPAINYGAFLGGYHLVVVPVNPAPEIAPTTFALGDTIRGEAVSPEMDVDEFSSTATPGDTLTPKIRLITDPVPSGRGLAIEVVDPGTGMVLIGANVSFNGATPNFLSPGPFVVPASGSYVIRVHGGGFGQDQLVTAPYEFTVEPTP